MKDDPDRIAAYVISKEAFWLGLVLTAGGSLFIGFVLGLVYTVANATCG